MENIIAILVILALVGLAVWYVIRAKKQGNKCIGCPESNCPSKNCGCCGCGKAEQ